MFATVVNRTRFGVALARGRDVPSGVVGRLIDAAGATFRARGAPDVPLSPSPLSDGVSDRAMLLWDTVRYAKSSTPFYGDVLAGVECAGSLSVTEFTRLVPVTSKQQLQASGEGLLAAESTAVLCAQTTGTTGLPVRVAFSQSDLESMVAATGVAAGLTGALRRGDRAQISTGSRAVAGNTVFSRAAMQLGAQVLATGQVDPRAVLETLRSWQSTVLLVWPSFLGAIVTAGEHARCRPDDFALRSITVGGEIVTPGLLARVRALFGDGVAIAEGYGCTETLPVAGGSCEQGHLHLDTTCGHVEFLQPDSDRPAEPGSLARLVITPYSIYRRAMPLLRYDAGDLVVQTVGHTCSRAANPAIVVHGKRADAAESSSGLVTARHVLEAVESIPNVELPVRCATTLSADGTLGVVVAGEVDRDEVLDACLAHRVPAHRVRIVSHASELRRPIRRRADLVEADHYQPGAAARVPSAR